MVRNLIKPVTEIQLSYRYKLLDFYYMCLDDQIVELVNKEYPITNEQASVLTSKIWFLVEEEILKNLDPLRPEKELREKITNAATLYDSAAEKLQRLNKPLLKRGAVSNYYRPI